MTHWAVNQLLSCPSPEFAESALKPIAGPDVARSLAASLFLQDETFDAILFIDDDIVFDPKDAVKLAKHIEEGRHVVGGCYVTKTAHPQPTTSFFDGQSVKFHAEAGPVKVRRLAGGFFMASKKVFLALAAKLPKCNSKENMSFYPFFMPYVLTSGIWSKEFEYVTEDYAFMDRARDKGFDIWLDPSIRLIHTGEKNFSLEDIFQNGHAPMPEVTLTKDAKRI